MALLSVCEQSYYYTVFESGHKKSQYLEYRVSQQVLDGKN